jgi:hypothetical protein
MDRRRTRGAQVGPTAQRGACQCADGQNPDTVAAASPKPFSIQTRPALVALRVKPLATFRWVPRCQPGIPCGSEPSNLHNGFISLNGEKCSGRLVIKGVLVARPDPAIPISPEILLKLVVW